MPLAICWPFSFFIKTTSPFERYPYYQEGLPTTSYIKEFLNTPFKIEQYSGATKNADTDNKYIKLADNILNYKIEEYRMGIYPFNSNEYLSYLNQPQLLKDNFKFDNILTIDTTDGLVVSNAKGSAFWIKNNSSFVENIFSQKLKVKNTSENILNTPYFHKQLFVDYKKTSAYGKYAGSAYLLLNSLPFKDLSDKWDTISGNPIIASTLKEIGASHHIPYHLILKWGSLYHRYKTYLTQKDSLGAPIDILDGFLDENITTPINGISYYDKNGVNNTYPTYDYNNLETKYVNYNGTFDCGFHPYYQSVYNKIINGYGTFNDTLTGFTSETTLGGLYYRSKVANGNRYWTAFVNNKDLNTTDEFTTLLPSDGFNGATNLELGANGGTTNINGSLLVDVAVTAERM
jgi:hypothetical protein